MHIVIKSKIEGHDNINFKCSCCGCEDFVVDTRHKNEPQTTPICMATCIDCGFVHLFDGNILEIL